MLAGSCVTPTTVAPAARAAAAARAVSAVSPRVLLTTTSEPLPSDAGRRRISSSELNGEDGHRRAVEDHAQRAEGEQRSAAADEEHVGQPGRDERPHECVDAAGTVDGGLDAGDVVAGQGGEGLGGGRRGHAGGTFRGRWR